MAERLATTWLAGQNNNHMNILLGMGRIAESPRTGLLKSKPQAMLQARKEKDMVMKNEGQGARSKFYSRSIGKSNKDSTPYSVLSKPNSSRRKDKRTSWRSTVAVSNTEDEDADLGRYQVNFPKGIVIRCSVELSNNEVR